MNKGEALKRINLKVSLGMLLCFAVALLFTSCDSQQELKRKQYYIDGQALYKTHCANCHHDKGRGLAGLYPPSSGSYF